MNTNTGSFPCGRLGAPAFSRRDFLRHSALGFGSLALAGLMNSTAKAANPLSPKPPHFPARAKRVILLFMEGGISHLDTIDYKPELARHHDQPLPESALPKKMREGRGEALSEFGSVLRPVANFKQHGKSGLWLSDAIPHIAQHADDLCILNGMIGDSTLHGTAVQQFHVGMPGLARPSLGAWLMYGLGTENENLPGFVVVSPPAGSNVNCGTAFLPGVYNSTILRDAEKATSEKIRYLNDERLPRELRRSELDFLQKLNRATAEDNRDDRLESIIESNELAFRMQSEVPEVLSLDGESAATKKLYGIGDPDTDGFGRQCLMARRLAEAGVRFIQVTSKEWDHHDMIDTKLPKSCRQVDQPIAGLLADLKSRGLFDDTLVIWSGEFGRTPNWQKLMNQKDKPPGRGHNPFGWGLWMAGGGVKRGFAHGCTDDFGYNSVEGRVHYHDLHATILHLLGLDHEKLTYMFGGRPYRLTDVYGEVVKDIVA